MLTARAGSLTFDLPETLSELQFGQAIQLMTADPSDLRQILCIVTGKTIDFFRQGSAVLRSADIAELITARLAFISELTTAHSLPLPAHITIQGKQIRVPKNLGAEATTAQWWDLEDELKKLDLPEEGVPLHQVAGLLLSVFLAPTITGEPYTDIEQAHSILPILDTMPCTHALPIAAFFLSSYATPTLSGISYSRKASSRTRKLLKWLKGLRLVFRRSLIISPFAS